MPAEHADVTLIEDEHTLARWLAQAEGAIELGLDTEADGMFRYRARLCYVQLATRDAIAVLDSLQVPVARVAALLSAGGPPKLLHDLAFDARLLAELGVALGPVFDTAIAARFLGVKATGLKSLLASELGIELDKAFQQADWGERPLPEGALPYLADDVRHLGRLAAQLRARLAERDITAEVADECAYALAEAQRARAPQSAFSRFPNTRELSPRARARLYALADAREQLAEQRDVPSGRLVPSGLLVSWASEREPSESTLARFLAPDEIAVLREAFARGDAERDAPDAELARLYAPAPPAALIKLHKRRRALLVAFRERAAAERGVDAQVVLPGHCITDLVHCDALLPELLRDVAGLGERRLERYALRLADELGPSWGA
jgi:ribonuclease D